MKRFIKTIIIFLIMIPIIINAGTYDSEKEKANNYILSNTYKSYPRYLIDNADYGYSSNGKITPASGFEHGGFISKYEYENSKINGSSYLYTTTNYWTLTSDGEKMYVVDIPSSQPKNSNNRARVTEFVKKETKVTGRGTITNPWIFVPLYKVTVKSNDTTLGTINESDNNSYYERGQNAVIGINIKGGNLYINNSCGATYSDKKITINRIFKDTECEVIFGTGLFNITLGEDSDEIVPRHIYLRFSDGYYSDELGKNPIDAIKSYAEVTGYTFKGLETEDGLLVIDENKNIINSTANKIDGDIQLKVKREANSYDVTFNPNGGSVATTSKTVTYDGNYGILPTPTRTGYTFDGWYNASSGGTKIESTTKVTITSNQTLYAHWTANSYTVTFNQNGGNEPSIGSKSVTYDSTYGALATVTRTGFAFDGWYTASSGGTKIESSTTVKITSNQTLYAHWTQNVFTVTFNSNGGNTPSIGSKSVTYNSTYGTLATVTRTGYNFAGWYTASSGGSKIESSTKVTITSNQTLYAHWTVKTITVTFLKNDGTDSKVTEIFTYGVANQRFGYNTDGTSKYSPNNGSFGNWKQKGKSIDYWVDTNDSSNTPSVYSGVSDGWINNRAPAVTLKAHWRTSKSHVYYQINDSCTTLTSHTVIESPWNDSHTKGENNYWKKSNGSTYADLWYRGTTYSNIVYRSAKTDNNYKIFDSSLNYSTTWDGNLGLSDIVGPNGHNQYMEVKLKSGKSVPSGKEWKCIGGDCAQTYYNQATAYKANQFCDCTYRDCTVVLRPNCS